MKYTVLQMVQDILSAMDSDEVNSISDTIEAQQVATIIKNCYNDITTDVEFPDLYTLLQLQASGSTAKPVSMTIPTTHTSVEWVRYDKKGTGVPSSTSAGSWTSPDGVTIYFGPAEANFGSAATGETHQQFSEIVYLPLEKFLDEVQDYNSNDPTVVTYNVSTVTGNVPLLCRNDKHPDYWTILDNRTIVFDSYDASVDDTLVANKTMAYGKVQTAFTLTDNWTINLDDKFTSYLFNEAKATAFAELKQVPNSRAEKMSRLAKIKTQKVKKAAPYGHPASADNPDYGRHYGFTNYKKGIYR